MTHELPGPRIPDRIEVTPHRLFEDNQSQPARLNRAEFDAAKSGRQITLVEMCSDARGINPGIPNKNVTGRNIAAADQIDAGLLSARFIRNALAITHFDGNTVIPGERPVGCGGLGAKEKIASLDLNHGVGRYVANRIAHPDFALQALITAEHIASHDKPVLAGAQNHITGDIIPLALFLPRDGQMTIHTSIRMRNIIDGQYDPSDIYKDGVPALDEDVLPEEFQDTLREHRERLQRLYLANPNFRRDQALQNPQLVWITDELIPLGTRLPETSKVPGSIFKLFLPRTRSGGILDVSQENVELIKDQLDYPINHNAIKNSGDPTKPFNSTNTIVIETGDFERSRLIAEELAREEWMRQFLAFPERRILIAQSISGITNAAEWLR